MKNLIANLSENERKMIENLSRVVDIVGDIFAEQRNHELPGGNLYSADLTREEFDQAAIRDPELLRFDTVVERVTASEYKAIPYNEKYHKHYQKMIPLLQEAKELCRDSSFRVYLNCLISCLREGTPEAYQHMMAAWVETKDYYINFPFTYDELYMDRLMGLKGGFNAALFIEDKEFTAVIDKPRQTWPAFLKTLNFPRSAKVFTNLYPAVYYTYNHQGMMADMKLRAWNLPNDFQLRSEIGARQIIIRESILNVYEEQALPVAKVIFSEYLNPNVEEKLKPGLFWTITSHELSHNAGRYEREKEMEKYAPVFEELKAYVLPVMWLFFCEKDKVCKFEDIQSAIIAFFAMNIIDCVLAQKIKAREGYCQATMIHCNYLKEQGALQIEENKLTFDFSKMLQANRKLFEEIMEIRAKGNYSRAKRFAERYGKIDECKEKIIDNLTKKVKLNV